MSDKKFWGIEIYDATGRHYYSEINVSESIQHNRPTSSQTTYDSKYPYHIHSGKPSYYSGSCTATFIENAEDECIYDNENLSAKAAEFTAGMLEWLHNDLVKYIKFSENFIVPVGILETVKADFESGATIDDPWETSVSFDWEQVAEVIRNKE